MTQTKSTSPAASGRQSVPATFQQREILQFSGRWQHWSQSVSQSVHQTNLPSFHRAQCSMLLRLCSLQMEKTSFTVIIAVNNQPFNLWLQMLRHIIQLQGVSLKPYKISARSRFKTKTLTCPSFFHQQQRLQSPSISYQTNDEYWDENKRQKSVFKDKADTRTRCASLHRQYNIIWTQNKSDKILNQNRRLSHFLGNRVFGVQF